MWSESSLYFSGVTKSHLLYCMVHITHEEYLKVITEQGPYLKLKHWHAM